METSIIASNTSVRPSQRIQQMAAPSGNPFCLCSGKGCKDCYPDSDE